MPIDIILILIFYRKRVIFTLDTDGVVQCIILVVLLVLSGYFSSAETALTTVNRVRLRELAEEGNKKAENALILLAKPGKMLSTILICNNVVNLSASSLTTTMAARLFGNSFIALATGILTLLLLLFGEITPKTMATLNNEKLTLRYSGIILFLSRILTPIIFIIDKLSNAILRLHKIDPVGARSAMTEFELRTIIEESVKDGVIETEEREMINNVVDLGDTTVKDVMIPRMEMKSISVDATYEELKETFLAEKHTRIPVYEESTDNIVGIINMKDILFYENHEGFTIRNIMRDPAFTFEHKNTSDLLAEMRQNSIAMMMVLDEYGSTVGLITLEDLLEEIVGEIRDEYDDYENEFIVEMGPNRYLIDGSMKLDDVNDALDLCLESKDYDSIGGLIIQQLDSIPEEGQSVVLEDGTKLSVVDMDKNHIDKVELLLPEETANDEADEINEDNTSTCGERSKEGQN